MKWTTVLFDLDGTLLPMDQDEFVNGYFGLLVKKLAPLGFVPEELIKAVWTGTAAMVKNDGAKVNEEVFWDCFGQIYGKEMREQKEYFESFYREEFQGANVFCGYTEKSAQTIQKLHDKGIKTVLATNPIFPEVATITRMGWVGLKREDFELITYYENSGFSKPNPKYYEDILSKLGLKPEECLMVGNDVGEDMVAATIGMDVFLLEDCIINKGNEDISKYPHGDFEALWKFLEIE